MKKLTLIFLLIAAIAQAQVTGYVERNDCGSIVAPATNQITCKQITTASGRTAGQLYNYNGSSWELIGGTGSGTGGSQHQVDGVNLSNNATVNFQDSASADFTNPSLGNIQVIPVLQTGSGLQITSGLSLRRDCADTQVPKWNSGASTWDCAADATAGSPTWDTIGNPAGNQVLAMLARLTTWTWGNATGSGVNMFTLTDTASNSGTGYVISLSTAASSAAKPIRITAGGTANGVEMTTAGVLQPIGSGVIAAPFAGLTGTASLAQLPGTFSSKTFDNTNTFTLKDSTTTFQDDGDATKQMKFDLTGNTTGTSRTLTPPNADTHLLGGSHFAGTHIGRMERTGSGTYQVCRDRKDATASPGITDDSSANFCVGSTWQDTTNDTTWTAVDVTPSAAVWIQSGVAPTPSLAAVLGAGRTDTTAVSFATAIKFGGKAWYNDPTLGAIDTCDGPGGENDCDWVRNIATGKKLETQGNTSPLERLLADGTHTYLNAGKPRKSIWFGAGALSTDGTQCAAPAEVTPVASGPKVWSVLCANNSASVMMGSVRMPDSWDGGTVTFTHVYQQTAADTGALNGDIACQARSNGEAPSSTYGTAIAIDDAAVVGGGSNDMTTSAAVTCAGTGLAGGDMLYWKYILDATGTTTAVGTLHHLGFTMEYTVNSRSD
jgi:hypothetical protein